MFPGAPAGLAPGNTRDMILSLSGSVVNGTAYITLVPWDYYRERYWAIFVNGKWIGVNYYVGPTEDIKVAIPLEPGTTIGSVWACEVGQWDSFDSGIIPSQEAEADDSLSARRLLMTWVASYMHSTITGDTQLSSVVVTGARRGRNVQSDPDLPQRGTLTYSILANLPAANDRLVRWYSGDVLVAEGLRNGDGALVCSEVNGSGLSIACTVTYTAALKPGTSLLALMWPKSYQIHYSTSALAYPRTPEDTVQDDGNDEYFYRSAIVVAGVYNYNALQVDDEGHVQTAISAPSDSPKTINAAPTSPTITSVALEV